MKKNEQEKNKMNVIEHCLEKLKQQSLIKQNNKYLIQGYPMKPKVKIGSIWTAKDCQQFNVINVENKDKETWVTYKRVSTPDQVYSCLEPAFIHRFSEFTNR